MGCKYNFCRVKKIHVYKRIICNDYTPRGVVVVDVVIVNVTIAEATTKEVVVAEILYE